MSTNKEEQDDELLALSEIMDPDNFRHNGKSVCQGYVLYIAYMLAVCDVKIKR